MSTKLTVIEPEILPAEKEEEHEKDLNFARKNMYEAIEEAKEGLKGISDVAFSDQKARSYEVQHQYLKTMAELCKDLVQISKDKKEHKQPKETVGKKVQNNLFIGTTADLDKALKKLKNDS